MCRAPTTYTRRECQWRCWTQFWDSFHLTSWSRSCTTHNKACLWRMRHCQRFKRTARISVACKSSKAPLWHSILAPDLPFPPHSSHAKSTQASTLPTISTGHSSAHSTHTCCTNSTRYSCWRTHSSSRRKYSHILPESQYTSHSNPCSPVAQSTSRQTPQCGTCAEDCRRFSCRTWECLGNRIRGRWWHFRALSRCCSRQLLWGLRCRRWLCWGSSMNGFACRTVWGRRGKWMWAVCSSTKFPARLLSHRRALSCRPKVGMR